MLVLALTIWPYDNERVCVRSKPVLVCAWTHTRTYCTIVIINCRCCVSICLCERLSIVYFESAFDIKVPHLFYSVVIRLQLLLFCFGGNFWLFLVLINFFSSGILPGCIIQKSLFFFVNYKPQHAHSHARTWVTTDGVMLLCTSLRCSNFSVTHLLCVDCFQLWLQEYTVFVILCLHLCSPFVWSMFHGRGLFQTWQIITIITIWKQVNSNGE